MYANGNGPATPPVLWIKGKYEGRPLPEVDTGYLQFLVGKYQGKLSARLRAGIAAELTSRGAAVPPPPPTGPKCWKGPCNRCGCAEVQYRWLEQRDCRRVVRASCSRCEAWLGVAPSTPPYTDMADAAASPTAVLDAVLLAEEENVTLVTDGTGGVSPEPWSKASPRLRDLVRQQQHLLASLLGMSARRN